MGEEGKIIVGLGNPGPGYANNRHNIGFMVVDALARRLNLDFSIHEQAFLATGWGFAAGDPVLIKPQTYMNLSGEALTLWSAKADLCPPDEDSRPAFSPLVICDDLALPLGSLRLRSRGSSGGQNGLESVIEHLGREDFPRLRLGIAPRDGPVEPEFWSKFVLGDFSAEEKPLLQEVVDRAVKALEFWLEHSLEQTASRFNRRHAPEDL